MSMIPLFSNDEYRSSKSKDKLSCQCQNCNKAFLCSKKLITQELNQSRGRIKFCSIFCQSQNRKISISKKCNNCQVNIERIPSTNSKHNFCSQSCFAIFNNKHKTHGTRRSKLEKWLEEQLTILYPELEFLFNRKDSIGSELDIYIPSLKLAFELNGIFHYEPIYGKTKLNQVQNNDISKSKLCHEQKIDLCVIDTTSQKYFKPKSSKVFLDIITTIINERLIS